MVDLLKFSCYLTDMKLACYSRTYVIKTYFKDVIHSYRKFFELGGSYV